MLTPDTKRVMSLLPWLEEVDLSSMDIIIAQSRAEIDQIRGLFREYEAFLGIDLSFQNFEAELAALPGKYAAPDGVLLLAREGDNYLGCGALRCFGPKPNQTCEMKRLYVRPYARGRSIGRALAGRLVQEAVRLGYSTMLLDTLDRLKTAMRLYESLGFVRIPAYYDNPLAGVVYWKLDL